MKNLTILYQCIILLSCIALSACNSHIIKKRDFTNRAPVIQYGASDGYGSAGVHTVLSGETIQKIAGFYGLSPNDIIAANHLSTPYRLTKGTRLTLPPPQTYRVRPGDTIGLIARTFDIPPDALIATNGPKIQAGQNIRLPRLALQQNNASLPPDSSEISAPFESIIQAPTNFTSSPGRPSVQVASLGPIHINTPSSITGLGDAPILPGQKPNLTTQSPSSAPSTTITSTPAWSIDPGPVGRDGFSRPVQGPIVSTYGPKSGGLYNEGVNIAAPKGAPVRAAQSGTVVYVGDAVDGYGNLVLIKHAGGYITAYAHMDKILVKDHQQVQQGQVIGTVGTTGNVSRAQLHFEIRKGRDSINPMKYI